MQELDQTNDEAIKSAKTLTLVIYGLYAASFFLLFSGLVAVIINYVKRSDVQDTIMASHFTWQLRTFWWSILWAVLGLLTLAFGIGWLVLVINAVWIIYRLVKGVLRLLDDRPMYSET